MNGPLLTLNTCAILFLDTLHLANLIIFTGFKLSRWLE